VRNTLLLYREIFGRAFGLFARNPVLVVPVLATLAVQTLAPLLAPFGIVGGIAMVILDSMCWSALLACTGDAIRTGRVTMGDVQAGFLAHLGDVLGVRFVLWVIVWGLSPTPPAFQILAAVAVVVLLNAVPELISLARYGTLELLGASYRFMGENWIEWAPPNVVLFAALTAIPTLLIPALAPLGWDLAMGIGLGVATSVVAYGLLVRGLLFLALTESGRRGRAFRNAAS